jgi:hypothetical protein
MAREDDDQGRVPRWDAPLSDAALEQALLVVAVAGPAASPAQARAAHRRLRFARFLVGAGRVNEFGGPPGAPLTSPVQ